MQPTTAGRAAATPGEPLAGQTEEALICKGRLQLMRKSLGASVTLHALTEIWTE
jgi:hypothetical protein